MDFNTYTTIGDEFMELYKLFKIRTELGIVFVQLFACCWAFNLTRMPCSNSCSFLELF